MRLISTFRPKRNRFVYYFDIHIIAYVYTLLSLVIPGNNLFPDIFLSSATSFVVWLGPKKTDVLSLVKSPHLIPEK